MENKIEKAIKTFIETSNIEKNDEEKNENKLIKKEVLEEREGLIERVDRIFVDKSGRMLLRERY